VSAVGGCSISRNTIASNGIGILLNSSSGNKIFHNNFVSNTLQSSVVTPESFNTWDNGYPSGGNYWSDASNIDTKNGPNQDRLGSDGIADLPYEVGTENVDRYPLASTWAARVVNLDTLVGYRTIQEAADSPETSVGNTLLVHEGVFYENVVVRKSLNLLGEDVLNTIVDAGGKGIAIFVEASNVSITGFTIRNSGSGESGSDVYVLNSLSVRIAGNRLGNCYNGISMYNTSRSYVESNVFQNYVYACRLRLSNLNRLSGNIIAGGANGITLDLSSRNMIAGNNITGHSSDGVYLSESSNNTIYYNNFVDNDFHLVIDLMSGQNALNMSYPLGGNFWRSKDSSVMNYSGVDLKKGIYQNITGSDGIGDTRFPIYLSNPQIWDFYPQMQLVSLTTAVDIHDVAAENVTFSPSKIHEGQPLNITVTASNLGNYTENFNVTAAYDGNFIGTTVSTLLPRGKSLLNFTWKTSGIQPNRTYIISGFVTPVAGEENLQNNNVSGGTVNVTFYRDVAVSDVEILPTIVYQGWLVNITATVSNLGNISETLFVRFTSGQVLNSSQTKVLDSHRNASLSYLWNTSNVAPGRNYTLVVKVDSVLDEARLDNNNYTARMEVGVRIVGDVNGDNVVDILDIFRIAHAFLARVGEPLYESYCDLNGDKIINILDIFLAARNFGKTA
jgi:parallel beta-helix repeat protein